MNTINVNILSDELQLIDIRREEKADKKSGRNPCDICSISHRKCTYSPTVAKSLLVMAVTFCVLIVIFSLSTSASDAGTVREKYFKTVTIEEGDTLWSIALEYISDEYDSVNDYVSELKSMNGLSGDTIHAGRNLVVTYYSDTKR